MRFHAFTFLALSVLAVPALADREVFSAPLAAYGSLNRAPVAVALRLRVRHLGGQVLVTPAEDGVFRVYLDDVRELDPKIDIQVRLVEVSPGNLILTTTGPEGATARLVISVPMRDLKHLSVVTGIGRVTFQDLVFSAGKAPHVLHGKTGGGIIEMKNVQNAVVYHDGNASTPADCRVKMGEGAYESFFL